MRVGPLLVGAGIAALSSVFALLLGMGLWSVVYGQRHHPLHDAFYQGWVNRAGNGCCNNKDCAVLADADERERDGQTEVLVRGVGEAAGQVEWCPVLPHVYLLRGNVPDASVAHACVSAHYGGKTPCSQFICYQPTPKT